MPIRSSLLAMLALVLATGVQAQNAPQEDSVVARFTGAGRAMTNGKSHLMIYAEIPNGRRIEVAVPNNNEGNSRFDPRKDLADSVDELKPGDLIQLNVQVERFSRVPLLKSMKPYEAKPGEDQPNGFIFQGSEDKQFGKNKVTVVELSKLGQSIKVALPQKKDKTGVSGPDPDLSAAVNDLKEGDSVFAEISGNTLVTIEPYSEPQTGKLVKIGETEVDGHKVRSAEIQQDGKAINVTVLVPGKLNGKVWVADANVSRELTRVHPGSTVQFRTKDEGDKLWLRQIIPASKAPAEPKTETPPKRRKRGKE